MSDDPQLDDIKVEPELFTWNILFAGVQAFNFVIFVLGYFILKDISIVDIVWGLLFIIPNAMLMWQLEAYSPVHWMMFGMVLVRSSILGRDTFWCDACTV